MFGADVVVLQANGLFPRVSEHPLRLVGETIERAATYLESAHRLHGLILSRCAALAEFHDDPVSNCLERHAELPQDLRGRAVLRPHDAEEEVLGADMTVPELARLLDREVDDLFGRWREHDLARRLCAIAAADRRFDLTAQPREVDAERIQDSGG